MDGGRGEHPLDRRRPADLAGGRAGIAHPLEELEGVAVRAAVLVGRHGSEDSCVAMLARAPAGSGTLPYQVPEPGTRVFCKAVQQPMSRRSFRLGVGATTAAVAAFLLARLHAWPPHEDETLALFVGSKPLGEMLDVVLQQRGGAPLHFLLVHLVTLGSPTLTAVRLISVVFTIASIPAVAALLARLAGRRVGLIATVLLAASWVTLFHGIYGRMYGLFAFASAVSFLVLLRALERRRPLDWGSWALAVLATLASHQYGAFVLASQVAYAAVVWRRGRYPLAAPLAALAAVVATARTRSGARTSCSRRASTSTSVRAGRRLEGRIRCSSTCAAPSGTSWRAGSRASRSCARSPWSDW